MFITINKGLYYFHANKIEIGTNDLKSLTINTDRIISIYYHDAIDSNENGFTNQFLYKKKNPANNDSIYKDKLFTITLSDQTLVTIPAPTDYHYSPMQTENKEILDFIYSVVKL